MGRGRRVLGQVEAEGGSRPLRRGAPSAPSRTFSSTPDHSRGKLANGANGPARQAGARFFDAAVPHAAGTRSSSPVAGPGTARRGFNGSMRMFVAVIPPDAAIDDLADFLEPRQEAGEQLPVDRREPVHATRVHAGGPRPGSRPLVERLAAGHASPPRRSASPEPALPQPLQGPRALGRGPRTGGRRTAEPRDRHTSCSGGAAPEGGPFHPHITLARLRRPVEATRWLRVLDLYAGPAWTAGTVCLIASHLGEGRGNRAARRRSRRSPSRTGPRTLGAPAGLEPATSGLRPLLYPAGLRGGAEGSPPARPVYGPDPARPQQATRSTPPSSLTGRHEPDRAVACNDHLRDGRGGGRVAQGQR